MGKRSAPFVKRPNKKYVALGMIAKKLILKNIPKKEAKHAMYVSKCISKVMSYYYGASIKTTEIET